MQTLAVAGKEFSRRMVARTTSIAEPDLVLMLEELQAVEFIVERSASPEAVFPSSMR